MKFEMGWVLSNPPDPQNVERYLIMVFADNEEEAIRKGTRQMMNLAPMGDYQMDFIRVAKEGIRGPNYEQSWIDEGIMTSEG